MLATWTRRRSIYKVACIARFRQGITKADARERWAEMHAPTLIETPGLLRYVQNHVAGPPPIESEAAQGRTLFDGYSCGWWEDKDAFQASGATAQWLAPAEDAESMFDMPWLESMSAHVEAHTIIEGPEQPV